MQWFLQATKLQDMLMRPSPMIQEHVAGGDAGVVAAVAVAT
jgi:hypothetical protein